MFQYSYTEDGEQEVQGFITSKAEELGVPREAFAEEFRRTIEEEWRKQFPEQGEAEHAGDDDEWYNDADDVPEPDDEWYNDAE